MWLLRERRDEAELLVLREIKRGANWKNSLGAGQVGHAAAAIVAVGKLLLPMPNGAHTHKMMRNHPKKI